MNRLRRRYELAHKRWKLSPTDIDSLDKWTDYSKAKDNMFIYTNTTRCPWTVIPSDSKRHA
jgi:polyphosphate kinase 2 (PPK2 family)